MSADNLTAQLTGDGTVAAPADTPPPPPPMPEAGVPAAATPQPAETTAAPDVPAEETTTPPPAMPGQAAATMVAPAGKQDGWEVEPYQLRGFGDAVLRARAYLDAVQAKVDRMQGAELTPQLGTSPVGTQLAKKFDDRLNSADGLRAMLVEAMKRMEDFVTSAEDAARAYEQLEENTAGTFDKNGGHHHHHHSEQPPVKQG
jgi:hypothetical protein